MTNYEKTCLQNDPNENYKILSEVLEKAKNIHFHKKI